MCLWFSLTTFDIIADLSFGDSFGCLKSSEYHPWVRAAIDGTQLAVKIAQAKEFSWLTPVVQRLIPRSVIRRRRQHFQTSCEKLSLRLQKAPGGRPDFVSYILRHDNEKGMSRDEMDSNMSLFFNAGSETTATLLSGLTYFVLKNPSIMERLTKEIRDTFANEGDMDVAELDKLPYLNAVLKETLRHYPPAPMMFNRRVPKGGDEVCGRWIPGGVRLLAQPQIAWIAAKNSCRLEWVFPTTPLTTAQSFSPNLTLTFRSVGWEATRSLITTNWIL
jgi:cytochrome P450